MLQILLIMLFQISLKIPHYAYYYSFMLVIVIIVLLHQYPELGKLLYESNILHITNYSHKKSNLEVTYYFI